MRRLSDVIGSTLREDAATAGQCTTCRTRGTFARAVDLTTVVLGDDVDIDAATVARAVNGSPWCSATRGSCGCVHAEQRLVLHLMRQRRPVASLLLLSTLEPCEQCAKLVAECGLFKSVAWLRGYGEGRGREILKAAGVEVIEPNSPFIVGGGGPR